MSKIEEYRNRAAMAVAKNRESVRGVVTTGELFIGATAGGYLAQTWPTMAGIPSDAGLGIALLAGGIGMKQRDMKAIGIGLIAGYLHDVGAQLAREMPISSVSKKAV
jgi:hypothetical protein